MTLSASWSTAYLASEWLVRLTMLVYVPQRRSPAAARAWLLLIFFLPLPGLLLYGLMGRIYVPRQRIALQRQASHLVRSVQAQMPMPDGSAVVDQLPDRLHGPMMLAARLGDYTAVGGNRITLLPGYQEPLAALLNDVTQATSSLHILFYIFEDDLTGRRFCEAIEAAARRGVRCRVLMDTVGSRRGLRALAPRMRAAGAEVHAVLPVGLFRRNVARFDLRNHRKLVVIDGRLAYTGSQNIVDAAFIKGCPNEELVVRIEGPVVSQLQGVFLGDWFFETRQVPSEPELLTRQPLAGSAIGQVLPSGPGYGRENIKDLMISLIYAARKEVLIGTPYFVPDEPFLQALISASRRGVGVRLLLTRKSNQRVTFLAQQSYYSELLAAGIHIYLYGERFLHSKFMSVDGEVAVLGSTNMDIRSFALNAEVSLLAYDASVVEQLNAIAQRYIEAARLVDIAQWSGRPFSSRLIQNLARMGDSLL